MTGWLMIAGCLTFSGVACVGTWRAFRTKLPRLQGIALWGTAVLLGAASVFTPMYWMDDRTTVYGFPFPAAFFQYDESGGWADFVGPLTTPLMFANAIVWGGVVLYLGVAILSRRNAKAIRRADRGAE